MQRRQTFIKVSFINKGCPRANQENLPQDRVPSNSPLHCGHWALSMELMYFNAENYIRHFALLCLDCIYVKYYLVD